MSNQEWTTRDLSRLKAYAAACLSSSEAAAKLGRSYGATRFAACKRGIRFKSLGVKHSRAQKRRWSVKRVTGRPD